MADPATAALFRGNMGERGAHLMQMIGGAASLLDQPRKLMSLQQRLGERHVGYGVKPGHCDTLGAALLGTLSDALGEAFDEATCEGWCDMYGIVSRTMLQTAAACEAAAV